MKPFVAKLRVRQRTWELLAAARPGDRASAWVDVALITLIILNVIEVMLSTVEPIRASVGLYFEVFEAFSVGVFTVEYLARMWSCTASPRFARPLTGRIRFFFRPLTLVDLVAIVPFYLPFLGVDLRVARMFRLFRIFRILKLGRYSRAFVIIKQAIAGKREELVLTGLVLVVLLIISAGLMYYAERDAQPETFSSIPATLWWSVITLTTVGYGDVYPITAFGRMIAGAMAILGIGMVALPAGIISAAFVDEVGRAKVDGADAICPTCGRRYEDP